MYYQCMVRITSVLKHTYHSQPSVVELLVEQVDGLLLAAALELAEEGRVRLCSRQARITMVTFVTSTEAEQAPVAN